MIRQLFKKIHLFWVKRSSKHYCNYLRQKGVKIGEGSRLNPKHSIIDTTRPSLITIGKNVIMNTNFTLLTHDFVSGVFLNLYDDFVPSSGKVIIGNNVRFGVNCIVLKGVTIGDNCFIGAGSVVTSDIPPNSIASGNPAKVICSISSFYDFRKKACKEEAFEYAKSIKERWGRMPTPEDFWEEFTLFIDSSNINDYPKIPIKEQLGNSYSEWLKCHKALYKSFDLFIADVFDNSSEKDSVWQEEVENLLNKDKRFYPIEDYQTLLSIVFNCQLSTVESLNYKKSNYWDSIGHISFISALEKKFSIKIRPDDILKISSYQAGLEILKVYGINFVKKPIDHIPSNNIFNFDNYQNNLAFIDNNNQYTYSDIDQWVRKISYILKKNKLALILAQNTIGCLISYIACIKLNVPLLFIDARKEKDIIVNIVNKFKPEYIIIPSSRSKDFDSNKLIDIYDYIIIHYTISDYEIKDDLAVLLPTSGSTGSPKYVKLTKTNIISNALSIVNYLRIDEKERPITSLPVYYSYGLSVINSHLSVGGTILLTNNSVVDPSFWLFAKSNGVTSLAGVPYTYDIFKKLDKIVFDIPSLKTFTQAGGKMNKNNVSYFAERCKETGKRLFVMYGQTEATARISYLPPEKALLKPDSIGIPIPGGEMSLSSDGELIYQGDNVSPGYAESYIDLDKGDERNGILYTGDIAKQDEDGYFYIVGRKKRFVKVYGNRVGLDELELLLRDKYGILACIGKDDHIIIVSSNKKIDGNSLKQYVCEKTHLNLNAFSFISADSIPISESGKILYTELENTYLGNGK